MDTEDSKSFNLRKRTSLKINKCTTREAYAPHKSHQKVNKVIRLHTHCSLVSSLSNGTVNDFILPTHTPKVSLTWWDGDPYKIKVR